MKPSYTKILFFVCALFFGTVYAEHGFDYMVGAHHNYMRLKFDNPGKLDGFTTGVTTGFSYEWCWFRTDLFYEGYFSTGLLHGNPCQVSKVQEHLLTKKWGGHWQAGDCFGLDGYLGFGFNRFINHQDPPASCDAPDGLIYKYTKLTIPVAVRGDWQVTDHSSVGLYVEWRPDVWARLHILCCHLKNKRNHAVRVALPISHLLHCNERFYFIVEPFFDWNRFGKVCQINCNGTPFDIPDLTRWDIGIRAAFGVQF